MKLINASAGVHHRNGRPPDDSDLWVPLPKGTAPSELPPPETERQRDRGTDWDRETECLRGSVSLSHSVRSVPLSRGNTNSAVNPAWDDFLMAALGAALKRPPPPEADRYHLDTMRALVCLCRVLQLAAGNEPFYLSCRSAARVLGIDFRLANRMTLRLERDGVLVCTQRGSQGTGRATRFRYVGGK